MTAELDDAAPPGIDPGTASADIDLAAFRANIAALQDCVGSTALMVVVKADGYGHGILRCAAEARRAGAGWLGVATPAEALAVRAAGDTGPMLAWLYGVEEDLTPLVAAQVDVSAQSLDQISRLTAAAATAERQARVHLKVDTGLSRNGAPAADWPELCAAAAEAEDAGAIEVTAIWSHLAAADEPGHPSVPIQTAAFHRAYEIARAAGLEPALRHLGNSAAALVVPEARLDLVRVGIAAYGIDPAPGIAARAEVQPPAGDDAALPTGQCEADPGGGRRVVRLDLDGAAAHHGRVGAAGLRRRHSPAREQSGQRRLVGPARSDPRPGLHGSVRRRSG